MPDEYIVKFHPDFFKDLDKLNKKEVKIVNKQIEKIKENPTRFRRLVGVPNCYRVRTLDLRIVYYLEGKTIWFLAVQRRKIIYTIYFRRLYRIKQKLK